MVFTNPYLNRVYTNLKIRCANEKEFLQAVYEFFSSIESILPSLANLEEKAVLERLVEPERIIIFRVPWVDDKGFVQVNRGYRIQFNSLIGPYKGGIRFDESVNLSIMKFLGFEQIFKNALTGLPLGGGKGGSDFTSRGKSDNEIMRFCQSFMSELYRHIGPHTDVPAGDIGVGAKEIGYLYGYYKKLQNEVDGTFTGKGVTYGGSFARPEATGYGLCYFAEEVLKHHKKGSLAGKRIVISGCGNVGLNAAKKVVELEGKLIAMSEKSSFAYDEKGLDIALIGNLIKDKKNLLAYKDTYPLAVVSNNPKDLWEVPCEVALPCATQNEIELEDAIKLINNNVMFVCEGANMPTTPQAIDAFLEKGILFAPGKAANAGGVATSGLEMSQNAMFERWSFNVVDEKLHKIMKQIYTNVYETSVRVGKPGNLIIGANVCGFLRIYEAMLAQGVI